MVSITAATGSPLMMPRPPPPPPPPLIPSASSAPSKLASATAKNRLLTGQASVTCNCGQVFPNLDILERHMLAVHPENKNLVS